jgi:hypothetical protein
VESAHERGLGVARGIALSEREQLRANPGAQLSGGALGERDCEDRPRLGPVLAHGSHEPLDQHGRLAATRRGR